MGVWNWNSEFLAQLSQREISGRSVSELRKDHQFDWHEGRVADHRVVDHSQYALRVAFHLCTVEGAGQIRLAAGRVVLQAFFHLISFLSPTVAWGHVR